jgi:hypothetical protein
MNAVRLRYALLASTTIATAFAAGGCGSEEGPNATECRASILPGDLVITEVMANPVGQSAGKEWIEIFNATTQPIDLEGAHVVSGTGSSAGRHVMDAFVIEPGQYAVLAGVLPDFLASYQDYAYGNDLSLPNSGGDLALECGNEVVDSVTYPAASTPGVAMALDGAIAPDHIANSDPRNWCAAESVYASDGSRGTPGARNDPCGAVTQGTCNDNGTDREVIHPEPGDLVISEVMARVAPGVSFREGEWFEVYVARDGGVDINGLQLGRYIPDVEGEDEPGPREVGQTINSVDCLHYEQGSSIVFARSDDPELNGGLPHVDYMFSLDRGLGLRTENGGVYVGFENEILDYVTWANPWSSSCDSTRNFCGVSLSLDPRHLTPEGSSDPANWCFSSDRFSPTGGGTPGQSNASCFSGGPCVDEDGNTRDAVSPEPGDVIITEVMPNPQSGLNTTEAEWFEVLVTRDVDLNALQLGQYRHANHSNPGPQPIAQVLAHRECQRHEAGSYVIFARSDDPTKNSDLPFVDYVLNLGFHTLVNSNGGVYLALDGEIEDPVEFVTWSNANHAGISLNLDPDHVSREGSSDPANWCRSDRTEDPVPPYFSCLLNDDGGCDDEGSAGEAFSIGTPAADNPHCE